MPALGGPFKLSYPTEVKRMGKKGGMKDKPSLLSLNYVEHCWSSKHTEGTIWEVAGVGPRIRRECHIAHSEIGTLIPLQKIIFNKSLESRLITLLYTQLKVGEKQEYATSGGWVPESQVTNKYVSFSTNGRFAPPSSSSIEGGIFVTRDGVVSDAYFELECHRFLENFEILTSPARAT